MLRESEQFQRKLPNEALDIKFYPSIFNYEFQQPRIPSQIATRD